jgi:hypothetical protein
VAEDDRAIKVEVHDFLELPLLILFAASISDPTID